MPHCSVYFSLSILDMGFTLPRCWYQLGVCVCVCVALSASACAHAETCLCVCVCVSVGHFPCHPTAKTHTTQSHHFDEFIRWEFSCQPLESLLLHTLSTSRSYLYWRLAQIQIQDCRWRFIAFTIVCSHTASTKIKTTISWKRESRDSHLAEVIHSC